MREWNQAAQMAGRMAIRRVAGKCDGAGTWWHWSAATKPVPGGQLRGVVAAGRGLLGDDIDGAAQRGPAAAGLPQ
jgi:hypothetical protein